MYGFFLALLMKIFPWRRTHFYVGRLECLFPFLFLFFYFLLSSFSVSWLTAVAAGRYTVNLVQFQRNNDNSLRLLIKMRLNAIFWFLFGFSVPFFFFLSFFLWTVFNNNKYMPATYATVKSRRVRTRRTAAQIPPV